MKKQNFPVFFVQSCTIALLLLTLNLVNSNKAFAQIYAPEGLNMPGGWNEWTNPPVNNLALASYTQVAGGRVTKISTGITRWQTSFNAAATGGDLTGGSYEWLFTSGSSGNPWGNKWAAVNVTMNTLQSYTFNSGANNNITIVNGKWYTMNWKDSGYTGTQAIFMETSAQPVELPSISVPLAVAANQPATITLTTSSAPAAEELFYLLFTTNNWVTSSITSFTMAGSTGEATIPGQSPGAVVKYYAFSSTVNNILDNFDLYSIRINNNNGSFFSYTVSGLSTQAEILGFSLAEQTGPSVINPLTSTVTIEVYPGTPLTALAPTISVSAGASVNPASGVTLDFTNPVTYTVTAEDGATTKDWTVTVTEAVPNYGIRDDDGVNLPTLTYWYTGQGEDLIQRGFYFENQNLGALSSLIIKGSAIKTFKNGAGDVTGAQFKYKVWSTAGSEPSEYTLRNVNWTSNDGGGDQTWSGFGAQIPITDGLIAGNYNLKIFFSISGSGIAGKTEDGPFVATFEVQELSTEAEILSFELAEQTGPATINPGAATVNIEVSNGTALMDLIPTITISASATINPESGIAQDFTNPVIYTVTSESLTQKDWTVTVSVAPPPSIGWANLQWPPSGSISLNQSYNVYGQVYANGVTNGAGQGAGIQAWVGYSTENTNPDTWTNWVPAAFQGDAGNNDEFFADLGVNITTPGIYFYATRFQLDAQTFVYGGFQGGFWDGITNISGELTVNGGFKTLNLTDVRLEHLFASGAGGVMNQAFNAVGPQWGPGIADTITVQLRDAVTYSNILFSADVELSTSGVANVSTIPSSLNGNFRITIIHRNSIEITSALPVEFSGSTVNYAFNTPAQVYLGNVKLIEGFYYIYGGDVNRDGQVEQLDVTLIENGVNIFSKGYLPSDVDGSGDLGINDYTIWENNNNLFARKRTP